MSADPLVSPAADATDSLNNVSGAPNASASNAQSQPLIDNSLSSSSNHPSTTSSSSTSSTSSTSSSSASSPTAASMQIFQLDEDDVDYVTNRIDYYTSLYKADIGARLSALLVRHQSDKQTIAAQHRAIEQLQANVNDTESSLGDINQRFERLSQHHLKLREQLMIVASRERDTRQMAALFQAWRQHCEVVIAEGRRPLGGLRSHYTRRMLKNLFLNWRITSRENRLQRRQEQRDRETQEIRIRIEEEHHGQVQALKNEIRKLTATISASENEREGLEERMRQAFARGVCALNKEALAAFSMSHEQEHRERATVADDRLEPRQPAAEAAEYSSFATQPNLKYAQPPSMTFADLDDENQSETENSAVVFFQPIPLRLTAPYQPQRSIAHPFSSSSQSATSASSQKRFHGDDSLPKPRTQIPVPTAPTLSQRSSIRSNSSLRAPKR